MLTRFKARGTHRKPGQLRRLFTTPGWLRKPSRGFTSALATKTAGVVSPGWRTGWITSTAGLWLPRSIPPPIHYRQPWQPRICPVAGYLTGLATGYTPPGQDTLDALLAAFDTYSHLEAI